MIKKAMLSNCHVVGITRKGKGVLAPKNPKNHVFYKDSEQTIGEVLCKDFGSILHNDLHWSFQDHEDAVKILKGEKQEEVIKLLIKKHEGAAVQKKAILSCFPNLNCIENIKPVVNKLIELGPFWGDDNGDFNEGRNVSEKILYEKCNVFLKWGITELGLGWEAIILFETLKQDFFEPVYHSQFCMNYDLKKVYGEKLWKQIGEASWVGGNNLRYNVLIRQKPKSKKMPKLPENTKDVDKMRAFFEKMCKIQKEYPLMVVHNYVSLFKLDLELMKLREVANELGYNETIFYA